MRFFPETNTQANFFFAFLQTIVTSELESYVNVTAPFLITGIVQAVGSVMYLVLLLLPWEMPVYEGGEDEKSLTRAKTNTWNWSDVPVIGLMAAFFASSCGSERVFQSQDSTFGLCGPLALAPRDAVRSDKFYHFGFLVRKA